MTRLDGNLKYTYKQNKQSLSANLRIRPEYYGYSGGIRALKLSSSSSWSIQAKEHVFKTTLSARHYDYTGSMNPRFTNLMGQIGGQLSLGKKMTLNLNLGYNYQQVRLDLQQKMNLYTTSFFTGQVLA